MKIARRVARSIAERQINPRATGTEDGKDVMSILGQSSRKLRPQRNLILSPLDPVRANLSEDPKRKLSEEEILSQLT